MIAYKYQTERKVDRKFCDGYECCGEFVTRKRGDRIRAREESHDTVGIFHKRDICLRRVNNWMGRAGKTLQSDRRQRRVDRRRTNSKESSEERRTRKRLESGKRPISKDLCAAWTALREENLRS